MDRADKSHVLRPMSQEAIRALEDLKMNEKTFTKPSRSGHPHQQQRQQEPRPLQHKHGIMVDDKGLLSAPASVEWETHLRMHFDTRQTTAVKTPSATDIHRKSHPSQILSNGNNPKTMKLPQRTPGTHRSDCFRRPRERERIPRVTQHPHKFRTSVPFAATNSSNQIQKKGIETERPFRISSIGYDSRYEDMISEAERCDNDDIDPEILAQAIDKCRIWLKEQYDDSSETRVKRH